MTENGNNVLPDVNDDLIATKLCGHYRCCFATSDGMEVYQDLFRRFGYFEESCHVVGDPYTSAYRNGQREMMVYILRRLALTPEDFKNLPRSLLTDEL